jgi:hypothetical protein
MTTALTDHWRSLCENKYLGSWNLWKDGKYTTVTVTIERVTQESVTMQGGRKQTELLLYFKGKRTPMILTRKMGKVIAAMHGPIPKGWEGKAITLYVEQGFVTKDGPADVLRVKNERAGDAMKRQLRGGADDGAPEMPEQFGDDDPDKGP